MHPVVHYSVTRRAIARSFLLSTFLFFFIFFSIHESCCPCIVDRFPYDRFDNIVKSKFIIYTILYIYIIK